MGGSLCLSYLAVSLTFALSSSIVIVPQSPGYVYTSFINPGLIYPSGYHPSLISPLVSPVHSRYLPSLYPHLVQTLGRDLSSSSYFQGSGLKFYPYSNVTKVEETEEEEEIVPTFYAGRKLPRNLDLCYYLGADIFHSHVACNERWADGTVEGLKKYINELTFVTILVLIFSTAMLHVMRDGLME